MGAARQYCGALGKIANCQVAVSLHWRQAQLSYPMSWRLFLPKAWCEDRDRRTEARIPDEVIYQTKTALALELVHQAIAWDVPRGAVLADSFYGNDFSFRAALREKRARLCGGSGTNDGGMDGGSHKGARQGDHEDRTSSPISRAAGFADRALVGETGLPIAEESVAQGDLAHWHQRPAAFALRPGRRVGRAWLARAKHPPRVREWLLIEWPEDAAAPADYWLLWRAHRDEAPALLQAVRTARGRWPIEQDYRELKEELGLDHFEGRGWPGWHHHVTLVTLAFAFLRSEQLRFKKTSPVSLPMIRRLLQATLIHMTGRCPWCLTRFDDTS